MDYPNRWVVELIVFSNLLIYNRIRADCQNGEEI